MLQMGIVNANRVFHLLDMNERTRTDPAVGCGGPALAGAHCV